MAGTGNGGTGSSSRPKASDPQNVPATRKRHNKVRTGCSTCKIRRVRCDEAKPSCRRCVSTGRTCDGYITTLSYPLPRPARVEISPVTADLTLLQRRHGTAESRSYSYFIEVAAPSLAGAMDTTFWLREIPMICQQDEAIWHAVVCLSTAFESYISGVAPKPGADVFRLNQFSSAVRSLLKSYSTEAWWRALTLSTIFTCVSILEDNYEQAQMHFKSGYNLLQDFDTTTTNPIQQGQTLPQNARQVVPVSIRSLRSILIGFEMRSNRSSSATLAQSPSLMSQDSNLSRWSSYAVPRGPPAFGTYLTSGNLAEAISAAETLFVELAITSSQYTRKLRALYQSDKGSMHQVRGQVIVDEKESSHHRAFHEIEKALVLFNTEFDKRSWPRSKKEEKLQLHRSLLSLRLIHLTNRVVVRRDPYEPDASKRAQSLPKLCVTIVDLAEEIMGLEKTHGCLRSGGSTPTSTVMNPLYFVVKSGFGSHTRRRALSLLRRPRMEGLWDTILSAGLAEACMNREKAVLSEYKARNDLPDVFIDDYTSRGREAEQAGGEDVHPLARVCNITTALGKGRQMTVGLRTWLEWLEDLPGQSVLVEW